MTVFPDRRGRGWSHTKPRAHANYAATLTPLRLKELANMPVLPEEREE